MHSQRWRWKCSMNFRSYLSNFVENNRSFVKCNRHIVICCCTRLASEPVKHEKLKILTFVNRVKTAIDDLKKWDRFINQLNINERVITFFMTTSNKNKTKQNVVSEQHSFVLSSLTVSDKKALTCRSPLVDNKDK